MSVPEHREPAHGDVGPREAASRTSRSRLRDAWLFSGAGPLALVVLALLGSVLIPARQTWLITNLLGETTKVYAPAWLLGARLESGLAEEDAALQAYVLLGDTTLLDRYRSIGAANDRRLAAFEHLAVQVDTPFVAHLATVRRRVDEWRAADRALLERRGARAAVAAAVRLGQARYDVALEAMDTLSSDLAADDALRDRRVRALEHFSLGANIVLVLAAFAALYAVVALTFRERRLAASLRQRVEEARAPGTALLRRSSMSFSRSFVGSVTVNRPGLASDWRSVGHSLRRSAARSP